MKAGDSKASAADGMAEGGDERCNGDPGCYSKALPVLTGYSRTGARCEVEASLTTVSGQGSPLKL